MKAVDFRYSMIPAGYEKFKISRYHDKYYQARISIGVPAKSILLKHKLPTASMAEAWGKRLIERFRRYADDKIS